MTRAASEWTGLRQLAGFVWKGAHPPRRDGETRVDGSQRFDFCGAGVITSTFTSASPALTMPICCAAA